MTIKEALAWASRQLEAFPTAVGDARLLLQEVLQVERAYLVARPEEALGKSQEEAFRSLVARAAANEPVPYITGEAPFYGLSFRVTPAVLIPRPETELLVEQAVAWAESHEVQRIVDVGTGSGCIAVTLARHLPQVGIEAIDVSPAALEVARSNAVRHGVLDQIVFHEGSLLQPITGTVDLVVANLPYVSDEEWTTLDDGVKWNEPATALRGGPEGLDLIAELLQQAQTSLQAGGAIFLEIGWRQGRAAHRLASAAFPEARVEVTPDYAGHDRIVSIRTG